MTTDARISVRLQTRARADELVDVRDGILIARVTASRVSIVRGERSREKLIRVEGVDQSVLDEALS